MDIVQIVQDSTGAGNTRSQPPAHTYWCFTYNNHTEEGIEHLVQIVQHECDWYVMQEEKGTEGTIHIQGTLKLKTRQRLTALMKWNSKIHWESTRNISASIAYCSKQETRYGRQWTKGIELPPEIEIEEPYGWQLKVMDILNKPADKRLIYWYWEDIGNVGKTTLTKYLAIKHDALIVSGKTADIFHIIAKRVMAKKPPTIIIFDCPRSMMDYVNYTALEKVKDGIFCSGKYDGEMIVYNCPHVMVFANEEPVRSSLSEDRWVVVNIKDIM